MNPNENTDNKVCALCNERTTNLMRPGDAANLVLERDALIAKLAQSEGHHQKLAEELPKMREENKRLTDFLKDAAAFIRVANSGKGTWNSNIVLSTLIHDINGLSEDQPCFLPRASGYAKRERDDQ